MLNLLQVSILLFQFSTPNTNYKFVYKISNSDKYKGFATVNVINNNLNVDDDPNILKIGEFYENGYYVDYYSVLRFSLPSFNSQSLSTANLTFNKSSGYLSSLEISYAIGNLSFSNTSWTFLTTAYLTGNSYTFSVKNIVQSGLQSGVNTFYIKLSSSVSYVNLIGDALYDMPSLTIYTSESPSSNTYGCASTYTQVSDMEMPSSIPNHNNQVFNCFGYAIDEWSDITISNYVNNMNNITTDEGVIQYVIPKVIDIMKNRFDVNARLISSLNSPIYNFERRIAFRQRFGSGVFHFLRETSNSQWAEKMGPTSISHLLDEGVNPDNFSWYYDSQKYYDSDTYYFAINNNGDSNDYVAF